MKNTTRRGSSARFGTVLPAIMIAARGGEGERDELDRFPRRLCLVEATSAAPIKGQTASNGRAGMKRDMMQNGVQSSLFKLRKIDRLS